MQVAKFALSNSWHKIKVVIMYIREVVLFCYMGLEIKSFVLQFNFSVCYFLLNLQLSVRNCFIRGSVVRYVQLPPDGVDIELLHDATRREARGG